ncbi:unnamed protein product [Periconia digitata]|uniref:Uncharacterized protein n=1 Tax=Periconia digitata TaxID=1303443 RepID=A0A9W4UIU3_9PLEO|nr:unnamed protein product [Periconia digitata]
MPGQAVYSVLHGTTCACKRECVWRKHAPNIHHMNDGDTRYTGNAMSTCTVLYTQPLGGQQQHDRAYNSEHI